MEPQSDPDVYKRQHPGLVKRLFELEVPEIEEGIVEIKSIAREAGSRTKIAVYTEDENVDPVGACVGTRGSRVQNIVDELFGEKIDIITVSYTHLVRRVSFKSGERTGYLSDRRFYFRAVG